MLQKLGILFRHPCPHIHQQQGRVERKHRHVTEMGLTMLAQAKMPLNFWWDSFVSAVYLINRLPTLVNAYKSPFESLYNSILEYNFLKTFGYACFPFLRPYNQHKFQFKTSKCVFLGYSPFHKGYRCLHSSGRIYIARNVNFNEHEFPYSTLFSSKPTVSSYNNNLAPAYVIPSILDYIDLPNIQFGSISHSIAYSPPDIPHISSSFSNIDPILDENHLSQSPIDNLASNSSSSSSETILYAVHIPVLPPPLPQGHPMQTKSKSGVYKPKVYLVAASKQKLYEEPKIVKQTLSLPHWKKVMDTKNVALKRKKTWILVPPTLDMNILSNKWVYRTKYNKDGSLDKFKESEEWLKRMDKNVRSIKPIMESTYGKENAVKWTVYWRTFFIAIAELFGYNNGEEWMVALFIFKKK
uniref:Integrase catalytic domain-containing protein n=1 Tax=Cannabis sativa TaxID=3483 RepID=A0A803PPU2_CANSA